MNVTRLVALLAGLCIANTAHAQFTKTVIPGSACTPSDATIRFDRYRTGNGLVQHAPDSIDPIVLTCPVTPFDSGTTSWGLSLIYRDSTGSAASGHVQSRLFRRRISGEPPSATGIAVPDARVNSDSSDFTTINRIDEVFTHTFEFGVNVYWIQIDLTRSATTQTVVFYSIGLHDFSPSDIRLKHSVALLGHLDNGLGLYRFSYHGDDKAYVGVMAQEVEAVRPDAVMRGSDGYLRVSYSQLGLRMQSWDEWVAAGAMIPLGNKPP